ncbi:MAG: hypothetical protein DYG89_15125 [Caldilinea sp. CFX5]|nr:hypothetical protein [Caldilinea sp. CFX5]
MDQPMQAAIRQIDAADLSAAQYRAVRRLLDVAPTGHAKLTKERANELCCTTSDGATRRLLGGLQAANIIHYSTNGFVYIDFTAWTPAPKGQEWIDEPDEPITDVQKSDHPRALLDHPRAETDHNVYAEANANLTDAQKSDLPRAKSDHSQPTPDAARSKSARGRSKIDHPRALLDHNEAATYTHAHAGGVCLFVDPDPIPSKEEEQANKQTPDPESQALAFALLTHIRVKAAVAQKLASEYSLQTVREAVSYWWFGRESMGGQFKDTPGLVVYFLDNWQNAGVPALDNRFYRTDLYRNHRTQAEIDTDRQLEAEVQAAQARPVEPPPRPITPAPAATPPTDPHAAIWAQVLAELKLTMERATFHQWVSGATVYAVDGDTWWIMAPNEYALDWLNNRLSHKIRRLLSALLKQSVTVQFCLPEANR